MIENDLEARRRLDKFEKVYIENISVKGASLLSEDEIEQIIEPYQKKWLAKKDIFEIMQSLEQLYSQRGYAKGDIKIYYSVSEKSLTIHVEETSRNN